MGPAKQNNFNQFILFFNLFCYFATPRPAGTPLARGELGLQLDENEFLLWPEEYGVERREVSPVL